MVSHDLKQPGKQQRNYVQANACAKFRLDDWCGCIVIVAINHYEPYFWNPPITVPQMTLEKMYNVSRVHSLNIWMWAHFRCYGLHCWKGVTHDCLSDWKSERLNFNAACYLDMYPIDCLPIIVICAVSWLTECLVFKTTTADKHWALSPVSSITMMWFARCSFENLVSMSEKYCFEPYVCFTLRTGGSKELHLEHNQLALSHDYISAVLCMQNSWEQFGQTVCRLETFSNVKAGLMIILIPESANGAAILPV